MHTVTGRPFAGRMLERLCAFLKICGIDYDPAVTFTVCVMEEDEILATGSLDAGTIKCIAVSPEHQGEDLASRVFTVLLQEAAQQGKRHLMLFTKPKNQMMFSGFGFHPVVRTKDCLMMENRRGGLDSFLKELEAPKGETVAAIVANCNPFTLGHRYLMETASKACDVLHVFVLSEEKSMFSARDRIEMVRRGVADLKNVCVHPSGPYMVSSATFPSYFLADKACVGSVHCEVDVRLFGEKIAPALGITRRYVATEPLSEVTRIYNEQMKALLPEYGVKVIELERKTAMGRPVSASFVRECIQTGRTDVLPELLPETTIAYLKDISVL